MKLLLPLILIFAVNAHAAHVGPIGMYSNATMTSSTLAVGTTNLTSSSSTGGSGYGGGLDAIFDIGPMLSLEARALYTSQTFNNSLSGTFLGIAINSGNSSSNQTASYIDIPVLLNVKLGTIFAIHGGGYFGIATGNISSTTQVNGGTSTTSTSTNSVNDYGAIGGVEAVLGTDKIKILISADYAYGLANLNSGTTGASSTYIRAIQATAGVLFPF